VTHERIRGRHIVLMPGRPEAETRLLPLPVADGLGVLRDTLQRTPSIHRNQINSELILCAITAGSCQNPDGVEQTIASLSLRRRTDFYACCRVVALA
jgi:hypothetical protein